MTTKPLMMGFMSSDAIGRATVAPNPRSKEKNPKNSEMQPSPQKTLSSEAHFRINFLRNGPWSQEARTAWRQLAASDLDIAPLDTSLIDSDKTIDVSSLKFPNSGSQARFKRALAAHWEVDILSKHFELRNSLDEALCVFQLYELAIESGYLLVEDVWYDVRRDLVRLFWSKPARTYLEKYGFHLVKILAQRVGVNLGFEIGYLPQSQSAEEGRFAAFVSHFTTIYDDQLICNWLEFLDDFQVLDHEENSKDVFYDFLRHERKSFDIESDLVMLILGAEKFTHHLFQLQSWLTESEKPLYGSFYSYWMALQFGFDRSDNGYRRDRDFVDWSAEIIRSKRLLKYMIADTYVEREPSRAGKSKENMPRFEYNPIGEFSDAIKEVQKLWKATLVHIKG